MAHKPKKQISSPVVPVVIPADAVFLTARELAGLLRKNCLKSVYRLAKKNLIDHIHESGGLLFSRTSVNQYIAARLVPASSVTKQKGRAA